MKSNRKKIDRRTFLKTTGIGSASLALSAGIAGKIPAARAENENSHKKMPSRILGKTGAAVSILGMGGSIDSAGYLTLLRIGLNMGINFWDSAHNYGNGKNEQVIGQFFSKYPEDRKKVFQVTKASRTTDPKEMSKQLHLSLERMQTDYIDLYLIHMLQYPERLTPEMKAWVEERKKEGKIRFFGFSCHGNMARMLMHASTLGWIDAVMSSYNYQLMKDDDMQKAVDACAKADVGMIAMKTQGQRLGPPPNMLQEQNGRPSDTEDALRRQAGSPDIQVQPGDPASEDLSVINHFMDKGWTPEQARLKVVLEDERISVCLSEMTNLSMLKENVAAATDGVALSCRDIGMLDTLARNSRSLYCKGCLRCESVMGSESRIADVLRYMMYYHSYGKRDDARRLFRELPEAVKNNLTANNYSPAEKSCPQHIPIGKAMKEAARILA